MSQAFVSWLENQSAVGATITSMEDDCFEFEISDQTVTVNKGDSQLEPMGAIIEDGVIFDEIYESLEVGQTIRIGSGQWTFYNEPEVLRLIITEREIVDVS